MENPTLDKPDLNVPIQTNKQYDLDEIWKIVTENVRMYVSPRHFNIWFKNVVLEKIENGIAEISCDQAYKREWLETYHGSMIRKVLLQTTGQKLELAISIRSSLKPTKKEEKEVHWGGNGLTMFNSTSSRSESEKQQAIRDAHLNPKYLFSNFIVGAHNRLAHAVGEASAEEPGKAYNPIFFYGPTGVGKTHLMQAIGNEIINRFPEKKVIYVSIEQFMNEFIESIRLKTNEEFRRKYRDIDVFILDDIQFIETYAKTQEELFNTFNTLYQANKQIIMAADRSPKDIRNIADRLRSRFEGGMVADIKSPDYETRMAILTQLTTDSKVDIERDVLDLIAKSIENNVRELEGAAIKVISMARIGTEITMDETAKMLKVDLDSKRKRIKPEKIVDAVCNIFEVKEKEVKGQGRTAYVALARQVIMYLLRNELNLQLERIALEVNRKDHTTVLHACDKIADMMAKDSIFKEKVERCRLELV